jgi:hypothetical protein
MPGQLRKIAEMIVAQWKKIGITLDIKDMERATWEQNRNANKQQICMWSNGGTELIYLYPIHALPVQENSQVGPLIAQWYGTAGAKGIAPTDPDLKKCMELYAEAQTKKLDEPQQDRPGDLEDLRDACWLSARSACRPFLWRVTSNKLGNIPAPTSTRNMRTPTSSRPTTIFQVIALRRTDDTGKCQTTVHLADRYWNRRVPDPWGTRNGQRNRQPCYHIIRRLLRPSSTVGHHGALFCHYPVAPRRLRHDSHQPPTIIVAAGIRPGRGDARRISASDQPIISSTPSGWV